MKPQTKIVISNLFEKELKFSIHSKKTNNSDIELLCFKCAELVYEYYNL